MRAPDGSRYLFSVLLMLVGLPLVIWPRQIRDWEVRYRQRPSYLVALRLSGLGICVIAMLFLFVA